MCCRYTLYKKNTMSVYTYRQFMTSRVHHFLLLLFKCYAAGFSMLFLLQTCDIILWYIICVYCTHSTGCETTCKCANYFLFTEFFFCSFLFNRLLITSFFNLNFKKTCCYYIIMIPRPFLILNADIQTKGENTCGYIICK
jgi:hypothetical protein